MSDPQAPDWNPAAAEPWPDDAAGLEPGALGTPEQAAANVALLEAELDEYEAGRREMFRDACALRRAALAAAADGCDPEAAERAWLEAGGERRIAAVRPAARDLSRCARRGDRRGASVVLSRVTDGDALAVTLAECCGTLSGAQGAAGMLCRAVAESSPEAVAAVLGSVADWRPLALDLARHADPRRVMAVTSPDETTETERVGAA